MIKKTLVDKRKPEKLTTRPHSSSSKVPVMSLDEGVWKHQAALQQLFTLTATPSRLRNAIGRFGQKGTLKSKSSVGRTAYTKPKSAHSTRRASFGRGTEDMPEPSTSGILGIPLMEKYVIPFNQLAPDPTYIEAQLQKQLKLLTLRIAATKRQPANESELGHLYFQRGVVYHQQKTFLAAFIEYTKAIQLNPSLFQALHNRASLLCTQGDNKAALQDLDTALKVAPENRMLLEAHCLVCRRLGDYLKSVGDLKLLHQNTKSDSTTRRLSSRAAQHTQIGTLLRQHSHEELDFLNIWHKLKELAEEEENPLQILAGGSDSDGAHSDEGFLSRFPKYQNRGSSQKGSASTSSSGSDSENEECYATEHAPVSRKSRAAVYELSAASHQTGQNKQASLCNARTPFPISLIQRASLNGAASEFFFAQTNVLSCLEKKPKYRGLKDLKIIKKLLKETHIFCNYEEDEAAISKLAESVKVKRFPYGTEIYMKGQDISHLFVLFDGEVSLMMPSTLEHTQEEGCQIVMVGDHFGCPLQRCGGPLSKSRFSAIVTSEQGATVLTISSLILDEVNKRHTSFLKEDAFKTIELSGLFCGWEQEKLHRLAKSAKRKCFLSGECVLEHSTSAQTLFIIKRGQVAVMKPVPERLLVPKKVKEKKSLVVKTRSSRRTSRPWELIGARHLQKTHLAFDKEILPVWALGSNWFQSMHLERELLRDVGNSNNQTVVNITSNVLSSHQYFGELTVLMPGEKSPYSVTATTQVEVYLLDSNVLYELEARFDASFMDKLNQSMLTNNPPYQKLVYYTREHIRWSKEQPQIVLKQMKEAKDGPHIRFYQFCDRTKRKQQLYCHKL